LAIQKDESPIAELEGYITTSLDLLLLLTTSTAVRSGLKLTPADELRIIRRCDHLKSTILKGLEHAEAHARSRSKPRLVVDNNRA
jgi:hypothetical protein